MLLRLGPIPAELANIPQLTDLDLAENRIEGAWHQLLASWSDTYDKFIYLHLFASACMPMFLVFSRVSSITHEHRVSLEDFGTPDDFSRVSSITNTAYRLKTLAAGRAPRHLPHFQICTAPVPFERFPNLDCSAREGANPTRSVV